MRHMRHEADEANEADILELRDEAGEAGDWEQVAECDRALVFGPRGAAARRRVARVMRIAFAMRD